MSDLDLNKWKVGELRDELASRGLDTKGVKAALVKRLRAAINRELREKAASGDAGSSDKPGVTEDEPHEEQEAAEVPQEEVVPQKTDSVQLTKNTESSEDVSEGQRTEPGEQLTGTSVVIGAVGDTDEGLVSGEPECAIQEKKPEAAEGDLREMQILRDALGGKKHETLHKPCTSSADQEEQSKQQEPVTEIISKVAEKSSETTRKDKESDSLETEPEKAELAVEEKQSTEETSCREAGREEGTGAGTAGVSTEQPATDISAEKYTSSKADIHAEQASASSSQHSTPSCAQTHCISVDSSAVASESTTAEATENGSAIAEVSKPEETRGIKRKHCEESCASSVDTENSDVVQCEKPESATWANSANRLSAMKVEKSEYDEPVVLDLYNSDLNLVIDASQFSAHPLTNEGFAFMWAGARATHGVHSGKICYEMKVLEHLDVSHLPADEPNPHVVRLGFSVESSSLQLGEEPLSYGYGGTGKISTDCKFKDYGRTFQQGDVVLALLNMDSDLVDISFAVNGEYLGSAYKIRRNDLKGKALYPHVLTKNCAFEVNFGQKDSPMCNIPNDFQDFRFIGNIPPDMRERGTLSPERREDCEMIMMCGLPGAGKTVWAAEYAAKNPDKKYNVLGTNNIIDKMRVMGLPRKRNYHGRWDVLIKMATKCLNKMFEIGSKLRRNYILDQTNVYPTAQRRKMRNFEGFKRKAVVVVPTEEEYKRRCDKRDREEGKEIPDSAVLEMKANFKLPEVSDIFDEVIFTELQRDKAEELVKMYNEEGRAAVGPPTKRFHPNDQPAGGGGNRGGRNSGFDRDRDRDRGGSRDRGGDRGWGGRGGYNSPGPRNSWGEGSPQSGFDRRSPPRGGPGFGGPGGPRGFGGPGGFDGPPGGFGPGGRSPGGFGDYGGGYGGGSPGYGDRSPGGFGRGGPGSRGGFSGRGGRGAGGYGGSRDPPFNDSGYGGPEPYGGGYGREPGYGGGYEPRGYGDELRGGYGGGYGEPGPRGGGYGDGPRGGYGDAGRGGGYFDRSRGPGYGDNGPRGGPPGGYGDRPGYGGPNDYESSGYGKRNYDGSFKQESGGYGGRDSDRGGYGGRGGGRGGYADRAGAAGQGSDRGGGSYNRGGAPGGNSGSGYGASPGYGDTGPGGGYGSGSAGRGGSRGGASNRGYAGGGGGGRGGASGAGRGGPAAGPAASRWQSDNSQRPGQTDSATSQNQGGYGAYGAVKSEPASGGSVTSSYPSYDQSYGGYSSSAPTSGYQSYGYQSQTQTSQPAAPAAAPASQQWDSTASSVTAPTAATAPMGAAQSAQTSAVQATPDQYQQQWAQYYQQPQQQYYNPYYGQQAGGAATTSTPVYGTSAYGAK